MLVCKITRIENKTVKAFRKGIILFPCLVGFTLNLLNSFSSQLIAQLITGSNASSYSIPSILWLEFNGCLIEAARINPTKMKDMSFSFHRFTVAHDL